MKILIVEDDLDQLDISAYMLRRERFAVIEASDAAQALRRFKIERPDVVVVSLAMPPPDGFEVLRGIRTEDQTPVLVVTEGNDLQDIIRGLELGADDFITKPYVFRELTLRIRAILRRATGPARPEADEPFELGGLLLDPEAHEVRGGSVPLRLTPTEFRIFYTLAKNAEHVVPANRLLAYVCGGEGGATNSLRSHICHLRKKLGLDGGDRGSITSVPAVGYVLRTSASSPLAMQAEPVSGQAAAGS